MKEKGCSAVNMDTISVYAVADVRAMPIFRR